ncbi:MAG: T9SS type A sorting domain-containing protein [Chryseobacterium sp.]|jgi:hypothetical protein|uniref:T9SS type A sorting domain-containing protein n=1 Tax=Chryseobacterium sp. TaxID=1871047 RepID=UPI00283419FB|nr:T9SS type A sorting domain-containing protein [Chryseobacterium sp.]MDR2238781.1 T9SS type A sorting domain-containing protein [Chryseobacterium sp.]
MRKKLLFIGLLTAGLSYSQVTIGSGTRVDSNVGLSSPISIYYAYSLSQQLYLASEIGGPMTIQQLKFYTKNAPPSLDNTGQIDVWIGHTALNGFQNTVSPTGAGWIPVAQQQQSLTSGSVSISGNEITLVLDTPFSYNGTDNLVITVDENQSGDDGSAYPFYQTTDYTEDVTLINRSDDANPDPANPPMNYTGPSSTLTTVVQSKKYKPILTLIGHNLGVTEVKTIGDAEVSPNPASDFVIITSKRSVNSVDIVDTNGRRMNTPELMDYKIDVSNLASGIYFLKINFSDGLSTTKKIIKK